MTLHRPIIVLGMPRSGTSMTAGLFAQHGVWVGTCRKGDRSNPKGHFENMPLKRRTIEVAGRLTQAGIEAPHVPGWPDTAERIIRADGYKDGPWLWKGSAMYWRFWEEMDPVWVCARRRLHAIKASGQKTGFFRFKPDAVVAHLRVMDMLTFDRGGFDIETEAVVRGDYSTLEPVFDAAGLELDPEIVDKWVEPKLWRH